MQRTMMILLLSLSFVSPNWANAEQIEMYRVKAAADFALQSCDQFVDFNPKKYLSLNSIWQNLLMSSDGALELASYEIEFEKLSKFSGKASEYQVFCFQRLITLKLALGQNTPFSIKEVATK